MNATAQQLPPFLVEELTDLKNLQKRKEQEKENKSLRKEKKILSSFLAVFIVMYLPLVAWILTINNEQQRMRPIVSAIEKTISIEG